MCQVSKGKVQRCQNRGETAFTSVLPQSMACPVSIACSATADLSGWAFVRADFKGRVTLIQIRHIQELRVDPDIRVARPLSVSIVVLYVPISSYSCAVLCITTEEDHRSVVETFG